MSESKMRRTASVGRVAGCANDAVAMQKSPMQAINVREVEFICSILTDSSWLGFKVRLEEANDVIKKRNPVGLGRLGLVHRGKRVVTTTLNDDELHRHACRLQGRGKMLGFGDGNDGVAIAVVEEEGGQVLSGVQSARRLFP